MTPHPRGPKPTQFTSGVSASTPSCISAALFFAVPLYVMIVTSLKTMDEIRLGQIFALPLHLDFTAWKTAWSGACSGSECGGVRMGFWNSVKITVPAVAISVFIGAINGYALSFWRPRGGRLMFGMLMAGALVPYQIFLYPLVRAWRSWASTTASAASFSCMCCSACRW
jgi:glucose/mannose transport system permease protein